MIRPRPDVSRTPAAPHGGPAGAADVARPPRIDFSASINAFGPAEAVLRAIREAPVDAYPDPDSTLARRAVAARWRVEVEEVALGAGAELIHATCFAFLRPGDTVLVPGPTFGEYARASALSGARILQGTAPPPTFDLDPEAIAAAVVQHRPRLVFLCTPNNPTGQALEREQVRGVADACAAAGTLLVLDQAYDAFVRTPLGTPALAGHPAVLALRSLTKDHALAGVRVGVAVGPAPVVEAVERARPPWSASALAQAATVAALSGAGEAHLAATLPRLREERARLETALTRLGIAVAPSETHYLLARVGDAAAVSGRLLDEHGIRVRDCTSFGLAEHVRIAARLPEENDALLLALEAVCST